MTMTEDNCEKSEKVERDRKTSPDSSNAVEELDPVAWISDGGAILDIPRAGYDHPLVRLSSLQSILDRFEEIADEHRERSREHAQNGRDKDRYACASVADVIHDEVVRWRNRIEEVTQKGEAD